MKVQDFRDFDVRHVKAADVTATKAPLDSVNLYLILHLDDFIGRCGLPVVLLPNGLTTGTHRASWHPRGLAADVAFGIKQEDVKIYDLWKLAIECGFKGVGIYWNGVAYSMHLDLRPVLSTWGGVKTTGADWAYYSLFNDPRKFTPQ